MGSVEWSVKQRERSFDLVARKLVEIVLERTMASGKSDEFPL